MTDNDSWPTLAGILTGIIIVAVAYILFFYLGTPTSGLPIDPQPLLTIKS